MLHFLYPLKVSETLRFSDVFRGHRNITPGRYGLNRTAPQQTQTYEIFVSARIEILKNFISGTVRQRTYLRTPLHLCACTNHD